MDGASGKAETAFLLPGGDSARQAATVHAAVTALQQQQIATAVPGQPQSSAAERFPPAQPGAMQPQTAAVWGGGAETAPAERHDAPALPLDRMATILAPKEAVKLRGQVALLERQRAALRAAQALQAELLGPAAAKNAAAGGASAGDREDARAAAGQQAKLAIATRGNISDW